MGRLQGQAALVTGASAGVGKAIALALAAEGAKVAITARRADLLKQVAEQIRALGAEALDYPADVTDPAAVKGLFDAALSRFGRLDILVNNAGGNIGRGKLSEITVEGWKANYDLNVTSALMCAQAALPTMRSQRQGTIINISSGSGKRPTVEAGASYSAAKAAMIMFNRFINMEERQHGIRACVIVLGTTDTPAHHQGGPPKPEVQATWMYPEDIAQVVTMVAALPHRATIEELEIRPTDISHHFAGWRYLGSTLGL